MKTRDDLRHRSVNAGVAEPPTLFENIKVHPKENLGRYYSNEKGWLDWSKVQG